jgi:hypothetical protein
MNENDEMSARVIPVKVVAQRIAELMAETDDNLEQACWRFINEPPDNPLKRLMRQTWDTTGRDLLATWFYQSAELDLKEPYSGENA